MHRKEVTHSNGSYERNRVGGNWLMKLDEVKKCPWYTHRLMHRKRVTCELQDSYFRWMMINHAIPKIEQAIEWAWNYYIIQSIQELQLQLEAVGDGVIDELWQEKPHQAEGALGAPDEFQLETELQTRGPDELRSGEDADKMQ